MVNRMQFTEWDLLVEAVDTRAGSINISRLGLLVRHVIQERHDTLVVVVHVGHGMRDRVAHAGLGREVHDVREAVLLEELVDDRRVTHIRLDDVVAELRLEALRPPALHGRRVVVVEGIDADDDGGLRLGVALAERSHERHANKARAARHQDSTVGVDLGHLYARRAGHVVPLLLGVAAQRRDGLGPRHETEESEHGRGGERAGRVRLHGSGGFAVVVRRLLADVHGLEVAVHVTRL
mmetsp:Transcript_4458/g.12679  ORF Transcript_4458/g.12679 Transcript_4458/m.12679 type:complete len:237 (-) Transcript_4458:231-941(-)